MNFAKYPILRGLVPYISGILFASFFSISSFNILIIIASSSLLGTILFLLICKFFRPVQEVGLLPFFILFFLSGFTLTNIKNYSASYFLGQEHALFSGKQVAQIVGNPVKKEKSVAVVARIKNPDYPACTPKAILYLKSDSASSSLSRGDLLLIDVELQPPAAPKNPDAFDYQAFLFRKGITLTGYLDSHSWVLLEHRGEFSPLSVASAVQSRFSQLFAANGLSGPEYSVITAVLLGNDDALDPELKSGYAAAGVSHLLCVSGMHVGIIYMILNFLLKPLDYSRRLRFTKSLLLIVAVWSYAAVTGLAPSVQRSAMMFTFVTIGEILRRHVNIFHSLFASMFLLLLINPLLVFEIGFQMSYLAVFGIVIFQPRLAALYNAKSRLGKYFWELVCVSAAAQLATFPLSVYYFGQFPNYFLLSNLSVMSLSFVVIVTGVVLLSLSWWPSVAGAVGWLLTREIRLMNGIITFIRGLPYSVTDQLYFSFPQALLIYGMIILFFFYFLNKTKILKYCSLSLTIVVLLTFTVHLFQRQYQEEITFYSIDRKTVVGINQGVCGTLLLDSAALASTDWYDFHVKSHERRLGIKSRMVGLDGTCSEKFFYLNHNFLYYNDKSFFFLSKKTNLYPHTPPLSVDYLFVQDNCKIPFYKLLQTFEIKQVVVGNGVTPYYENRWRDSCALHQIPVYSLRESGYLTLKSDN